MSKKRLPDSDDILKAVAEWGNSTMTYVVRNRLESSRFNVSTPWVLRRLKGLEIEGKVKRVSSNYATQLCWTVVQEGPPA